MGCQGLGGGRRQVGAVIKEEVLMIMHGSVSGLWRWVHKPTHGKKVHTQKQMHVQVGNSNKTSGLHQC